MEPRELVEGQGEPELLDGMEDRVLLDLRDALAGPEPLEETEVRDLVAARDLPEVQVHPDVQEQLVVLDLLVPEALVLEVQLVLLDLLEEQVSVVP